MGSIPACAGEPATMAVGCWAGRVYPRVCGGTSGQQVMALMEYGLSPRVRGNLAGYNRKTVITRSIPACAGEPKRNYGHVRCTEVYPRVCGGTLRNPPSARHRGGLSPRVRGNRGRQTQGGCAIRSIPACAGEPLSG